MISYSELVKLEGPVRYDHTGKGHLKMLNHDFPWSITEVEFQFIYNYIIERQYIRGFEVATAFGISSLAAALAFKDNRGKIVTMDAYVEEAMNDPMAYKTIDPSVYDESDGFKSVTFLREYFELNDVLYPVIGWSPTNVSAAIREICSEGELDYAFIDAGHFEDSVRNDILAVAPFMKKGGTMLFHDVYDYFITPAIRDLIRDLSGNDLEVIIPHPYGENTGVVEWAK